MHSKIDVPKKVKATYNLERIEYYLKKFNNRSGPAHRNTIHTMRVAWVHRRERFLLASVDLAGPSASFFF